MWKSENSFDNIKEDLYPWRFIHIHGEPERFRTFVDEMVSAPHRFTKTGLHDHVMSATSIFQQHLGTEDTDLRFIGKVENFEEDMAALKKVCSDYFEPNDNMLTHQMPGYGWSQPSSWSGNMEMYRSWIETMGLMPIYNYWKEHGNTDGVMLPPAYFAIDETTYQKIVDFYIQDLKCFGYEHQISYQNFLDDQLGGHPNIYEDPKYNYERHEE